jgi:predicted cupin superfamily sugar epimerase
MSDNAKDWINHLQLIIPAGAVVGAEVLDEKGFTILWCLVSPGFHFDDFELIGFNEMVAGYPEQESVIRKLT